MGMLQSLNSFSLVPLKIIINHRDILKIAAPIALALLIPQINFLTNTAFIGRLGQDELGVNGISGVFYLLLAMLGYGLSNGLQVLMARRVGEGNQIGLGKILANGIVLSLLFSLVLMLLSLWIAPLIFSMNLQDDQHILLSVDFIFVRIWGLPFLMLTQLANAFFIATARSKFIIWGSVLATVVNITLDYCFIFGHAGFHSMGLRGAAWASVCSEVASAAMMWALFYARKMQYHYHLGSLINFNYRLAVDSLRLAMPLILQYLFSIGGWLLFFFYVEHLGTQELAASQMLRSVLGIVGVCTWAFASTCNTLVSRTIGQGLQQQVPPLIWKIGRLSLTITAIISALLLLFPSYFLSMYTNDSSLVVFSIPALRSVVVGTLLMSIATVVFNGVVGTGNTWINLLIEVTGVLIYIVYCYFFIQQWHCSLYVAWLSECVYWFALLAISVSYLRSGRWKGKVI
jgi:MATE family multidrug resistance protein